MLPPCCYEGAQLVHNGPCIQLSKSVHAILQVSVQDVCVRVCFGVRAGHIGGSTSSGVRRASGPRATAFLRVSRMRPSARREMTRFRAATSGWWKSTSTTAEANLRGAGPFCMIHPAVPTRLRGACARAERLARHTSQRELRCSLSHFSVCRHAPMVARPRAAIARTAQAVRANATPLLHT